MMAAVPSTVAIIPNTVATGITVISIAITQADCQMKKVSCHEGHLLWEELRGLIWKREDQAWEI